VRPWQYGGAKSCSSSPRQQHISDESGRRSLSRTIPELHAAASAEREDAATHAKTDGLPTRQLQRASQVKEGAVGRAPVLIVKVTATERYGGMPRRNGPVADDHIARLRAAQAKLSRPAGDGT
jgi:hypothetical protein